MERNKILAASLVILIIAAAGAGFYFAVYRPSMRPLLKIGTLNYAWGGTLTTVCRDGRVYVGPYSPSATEASDYRLAAVLDRPTVSKLMKALGDRSFAYNRSFHVPDAFDADYEVTAEYFAGPKLAVPTDQDIENYRTTVARLAEGFAVADASGQPLRTKVRPPRDVCSARAPAGRFSAGKTEAAASAVWPQPPGGAPETRSEAGFGETFFLIKAGDTTAIKGETVSVTATKISDYCPEQPAGIDYEFVTSAPGSCSVPKVSYVEEYEITVDGRTFKGSEYLAKPGDRLKLQVVHPEHSSEFRVYDLAHKCDDAAGQENVYCWNSAAFEAGMPEWCDRIDYLPPEAAGLVSVGSLRDSCKTAVALRRDQVSACLLIQDAEAKDRCYERLAWKHPELCGHVQQPKAYCTCRSEKDQAARNLCLEQVIGADANLANDPSLCAGLKPVRGACLHIQALVKEDIGLCPGIVIYKEEVNCYLDMLRLNRRYEARPQGLAMCDPLPADLKDRCVSVITKEGLLDK